MKRNLIKIIAKEEKKILKKTFLVRFFLLTINK